jgi:hypothetical protein
MDTLHFHNEMHKSAILAKTQESFFVNASMSLESTWNKNPASPPTGFTNKGTTFSSRAASDLQNDVHRK